MLLPLLTFHLAAAVPRLPDVTVKIDGTLNEEAWERAELHRGLWKLGDRSAAKASGECRFFLSGRYLYGALTAFEPDVSTLKMSVKPGEQERYPQIHENDEVMNLFFSEGDRCFCQIAFTPSGVRTFQGVRPTRLLYDDWRQPRLREEWSPRIEHAVRIVPGRWTVEFRLNLDDFDNFRSGRWRFNFCRERRAAENELSTLFPMTGTRFNDFRQYGAFRLEGQQEYDAVSPEPMSRPLVPEKLQQWQVLNGKLRESADGLILAGGTRIISSDSLPVFQGQSYRLSGELKSLEKQSLQLFFGLQLLDSRNREILPQHVLIVPRSDTTLTAPASPGDSELLVKDASGWKTGPNYFVALNTKPDYSDLPNRQLSYVAGIREINRENGFWRVRLHGPHRFTAPVGTSVRLHLTGASYLYLDGKALTLSPEWRHFEATIPGFRLRGGGGHNLFWPGTASVKLLLWLTDRTPGSEAAFRNVKLESL